MRHGFWGLLLLCPLLQAGTEPLTLGLKDVALLSIAHNAEAQNAELQWVLDKYKWVLAKNTFQWQFNLSSQVLHQKDHRLYYEANPTASLALPTGGHVRVEGTWFRGGGVKTYEDGDPSLTLSETSRSGAITLSQPLLRGFGSSIALADLHNAEDQRRIDALAREAKLARTVTAAIKAYWHVLQTRQNQTIQEMALDQAKKVLSEYRIRVKVGDLPSSNATQQEAQVVASELALVEQKNSVLQAHQDLLVRLGLQADAKVVLSQDVKHLKLLRMASMKKSIAFGLKHHYGLRAARLSLEQLKRNRMVAKNDQWWELDVEGQINTEHNPQVGLKLSIPLRDLKRKQRLLSAKLRFEQAQKAYIQMEKEVKTEIINHWRRLHLSLDRLDLLKQKVKLSEKNYRTTLMQHATGRTSSFEVVAQQRQWTRDQTELINAQIEYLKTLADFHVLLGKTLQIWQITLREVRT